MTQDAVLGIDIGTSGVRIAARGRDGALLAMSQAAMAAPLTDFGRALQDPAIWWDALVAAFDGLNRDGLRVLALAVDGTSGTILPCDADGTPLGLASMYNDVAEAGAVKAIQAKAPAETAALGSTSPLARAMMMDGQAPRILHQADWLVGRLCGRFDVSDENNALKSGYDPIVRAWPKWISGTGFDVARFPAVVPAGERVGTILPAMARQFGLPPDVAVVAGTTDGCAAFLASGAKDAGDGVSSLGTTLTIKLLSATPVFAPQFGIYSHRIGEQWLAGGASNTGGGVLAMFFSRDEIARLTALMDADVPTGLDYYPLPRPGERFPINDPGFEPRLSPRPAEDHVFLQGLLEGIAAVEALAYRKLAELGASPLTSIRSVGGGAANAAWTKMRLRALAVPAREPESEHAAMGTARLAWRGIGHDA
ncbi:MAG: FGGY-family carbohydrate kinase [Rhizobiales bacterium]|nr:FGGY-family carbohydrate kinase [Hyphomicrobiales bacterium]